MLFVHLKQLTEHNVEPDNVDCTYLLYALVSSASYKHSRSSRRSQAHGLVEDLHHDALASVIATQICCT
jgi:hypothetical protein